VVELVNWVLLLGIILCLMGIMQDLGRIASVMRDIRDALEELSPGDGRASSPDPSADLEE
jgi:hypothetical protein